MASVIRFVVKDASRWVMRPKIVEALALQIRISSLSNQLHRISRISNRATGGVISVGLKVTSNAIALN